MKGVIFNLLEELVARHQGEAAWDGVLQEAGVDGAYTSLGSYPDEDLVRLVEAESIELGLSTADTLRWFGRESMPVLAERYPQFFTGHTTTRAFLLTLNDIIHAEVRKLYPGAHVPVFTFDTSAPDVLVVGYSSARRMCALAQGFMEGAAACFGEVCAFEHAACMLRGDPQCIFRVRFHALPPTP